MASSPNALQEHTMANVPNTIGSIGTEADIDLVEYTMASFLQEEAMASSPNAIGSIGIDGKEPAIWTESDEEHENQLVREGIVDLKRIGPNHKAWLCWERNYNQDPITNNYKARLAQLDAFCRMAEAKYIRSMSPHDLDAVQAVREYEQMVSEKMQLWEQSNRKYFAKNTELRRRNKEIALMEIRRRNTQFRKRNNSKNNAKSPKGDSSG